MKKIILLFAGMVMAAGLNAQVRHVPSQYPTIQSGINAANPGDTVLVEDGIYYEQINLSGHKPILLGSNYIIDGKASHVTNTIIDGSQIPTGDNMSVVYFGNGNDSTSVLCGFTVRGGKGTRFTGSQGELVGGGGIFINGGGATIRHNIITNNEVSDFNFPSPGNLTCGGGIFSAMEFTEHWTVISDNEVSNNTVRGSQQMVYGGGLYLSNDSRVVNNVIKLNRSLYAGNAIDIEAGGIGVQNTFDVRQLILDGNLIDTNLVECPANNPAFAGGALLWNLKAVVTNNEIAFNKIEIQHPPANGIGSGMDFEMPAEGSLIKGNLFKGNEGTQNATPTNLGSIAGALRMGGDPGISHLEVSNNKFIGNKADRGGAIQSYGVNLTFYNNLFMENEAKVMGGAIFFLWDTPVDSTHQVVMANNTFRRNISGEYAGAVGALGTCPLIMNSIFDRDSSTTGSNEFYVYQDEGNIELAYCDLDTIRTGNATSGYVIRGTGMMYGDPMFADLNTLELEHWSPCVDMGNDLYTCTHGAEFTAPSFDMNGATRPVGNWYDMGAYDVEAWGLGTQSISGNGLLIMNRPNPVTTSTTFSYDLQEASNVRLTIYDGLGKVVARPVNSYQPKGRQEVSWDASALPAGMYFYRLESGKELASGKIIKL